MVVGVVAVVVGPVGDAEGVVAGVVERWSGWCQWWWLVVGVVGDTEAGAEAAPRVRAAHCLRGGAPLALLAAADAHYLRRTAMVRLRNR